MCCCVAVSLYKELQDILASLVLDELSLVGRDRGRRAPVHLPKFFTKGRDSQGEKLWAC